MTNISEPDTPPSPPRFRGLRGAVVYGLRVFAILAGVGVLGGVVIWFLQPGSPYAQIWTSRFLLLGLMCGATVALCRWLCAAVSRGFSNGAPAKGELGALAVLLGIILAGCLNEQMKDEERKSPNQPTVGQAIDISGPMLDGRRFDLADHRGKVVLVDFWATYCDECVARLPILRAAYDKYHAEGLDMVSVSFDDERPNLIRFLKARPMPWPQVFFDAEQKLALIHRYGIDLIPSLFIIDREGRLFARDLRGDQISTAAAEALGHPVPWSDRVIQGIERVLGWLLFGLMRSKVWLLLTCGLGAGVLGAMSEAVLQRVFSRRARTAG